MKHFTRKNKEGMELWVFIEPADMPMPTGMKGLSIQCYEQDGQLLRSDEWELRWVSEKHEVELPSIFYDQALDLATRYIAVLNHHLHKRRAV